MLRVCGGQGGGVFVAPTGQGLGSCGIFFDAGAWGGDGEDGGLVADLLRESAVSLLAPGRRVPTGGVAAEPVEGCGGSLLSAIRD